jgi:AraC family transcriptional activator of pobA
LRKIDTLEIKNKLDSERSFKISPFKEVIKRTKPHKHDGYFEIIYLSEGAGFHWVDTQKFQISPPVVYFLSGQNHYWEMTAVPKGYVLLFKDNFFDLFEQSDLLSLIRNVEGTVEISLTGATNFDSIFSEMVKEYNEPSVNSADLIHGYLQVALVKLIRNKQLHESPGAAGHDSVYRKFLHVIQSTQPVSNLKVNQVASALNITPQHLNTVLKKVSGKSASELINEQVILEAKRYLLHTDKTVSEIAFALSFTDPSHFVKHFKKSSGETPQAFRTRYFQ